MSDTNFSELLPTDLARRIVGLRHDLHRYPELSLEEERTAERLYNELSSLDPESIARVAGTGVVGRVRGRDSDAPTVAIRGDIDALPIQEESDVEFASQHDGVMHACGHDVHAAWTVGAAALLSATPATGDVLILFQPAEETAQGASAVLESGVLDGVSSIVGAHVDMSYPVGKIVAPAGHVAASADEFTVQIRGKGSHAARPHEGVNPITGGAAIVNGLQSVVAQAVPSGTPAVVTVAKFEGGTASNIIPETATLAGTIRAADAVTRAALRSGVESVVHNVVAAHGLEGELRFLEGTPPLVNEVSTVEWVRRAGESVLGPGCLVPLTGPNLGGEDFAFYMEQVPGCFFRVGGRGPGQPAIPAHSSKFVPSDDAVVVGAAVLAEAARLASASLVRPGD